MISADRGIIRRRWADLVDEFGHEDEAEEEDVCVTERLPDVRSNYVVMEARDTVADLNLWIKKTQGLPRTSFVLSHGKGNA